MSMTKEQIEAAIAAGEDPTCTICGEPLSAHVPTPSDEHTGGPYTHPREARGEGKYVFTGRQYFGLQCSECPGGVCDGHDMFQFVPTKPPEDNKWRPSDV